MFFVEKIIGDYMDLEKALSSFENGGYDVFQVLQTANGFLIIGKRKES